MGEAQQQRVPCGDDMCTGVYGPDGLCGTCGRGVLEDDPFWVREEVAALVAAEGAEGTAVDAEDAGATGDAAGSEGGAAAVSAADGEEAPGAVDEAAGEAEEGAVGEAAGAAGDADERVPCDDDMCTGIYSPQGVCGTCGRAR